MALDAALERLSFEEPKARYNLLYFGVTYGDAGDNRVQSSIDTVLSVISRGVKNGRALARQTSDALEEMFAGVRAEIIAEFFAKEQNAAHLFPVARELESRAHARWRDGLIGLTVEAKSLIGVFADFVGSKRTALLSSEFVVPAPVRAKNEVDFTVGAEPSVSTGVETKIAPGALTPASPAVDASHAGQNAKSPDKEPTQDEDNGNPSPTLL